MGMATPKRVIDSSLARWWYYGRAAQQPHWLAQAMSSMLCRSEALPVGQSHEKDQLQLEEKRSVGSKDER